MNSDRVHLESKVTFLERMLDTLNNAMIEQGQLIAELEERLARIEVKTKPKDERDVGPHDEPPPHY